MSKPHLYVGVIGGMSGKTHINLAAALAASQTSVPVKLELSGARYVPKISPIYITLMHHKQYLRARSKALQAERNANRHRLGDWKWCYWYTVYKKWAIKADKLSCMSTAEKAAMHHREMNYSVGDLSQFKTTLDEPTDKYQAAILY